MPSVNHIRRHFLDFFGARAHAVLPSAPLVPQNDPTLLFVNAGMVQFKNIFTGAETPAHPRAATAQKCVRAGGKHNDLDNVGYTARHHTFFEMLGNFSFGDYFKAEAIDFAWTLLVKEMGLDPNRLCVTHHASDEDAAGLWGRIAGLPAERIISIASDDNFWSMGDTGPCGPCSEIFYDHGPHIPGGPPGSPDEDGDRFVEIWNLVFMQFEQFADGSRAPLPKPCIDTGMGLERVSAVLQGVHDNYDIDLFRTLILASRDLMGGLSPDQAPSHRVIADHLRSTAFLIADGVTPSNEGRGYVLRRIMRRAMRHAHLLGAREPVLHRLLPTLVSEMGEVYPELRRAAAATAETLRQEEERFQRTLGRGMALLEEATVGLRSGDVLPGETAFKLYDTYGFPIDLTQDAVRARGLTVDMAGFDAAMEVQRAQARENWAGSGQAAQSAVWLTLRDRFGATRFTGYESLSGEAAVLALVRDGVEIEAAGPGEEVEVLFDATPFYAESGGQAGDRGGVSWDGGAARVLDTQKQAGDLHVLRLTIEAGRLTPGARAHLQVDEERRARTRLNHSAAHLVHAALRHVLGPHVAQKGQMVDDERMRFDFSHSGPLTAKDIDAIESEVNAVIRQNQRSDTREMTPEAAMEAGAVALFGEKYGDRVRVLSLGAALTGEGAYSVELCGGTHVARTGDIALFKIVSEQGVAAGVRRIEALTGEPARRWLLAQAGAARAMADQLKTPVLEAPARLEALEAQKRQLEKDLAEARRQLAMGGAGGGAPPIETVGGVNFIGRVLEGVGGKDLRPIAETYRKQIGDGVIVLNGVADGKVANTVVVAGAAQQHFNAVDLARAAVAVMGGQGAGGKPDFAQGGAPDPARAQAGVDAIRKVLADA